MSRSKARPGRTARERSCATCSAQAAAQGYEFKIGIELEYFLVQLNADGTIEIADKLDTLEKPCYDMAGLTRQYDFLTTVSRYCNELGWGNYANDHEDANGQFEQNFEYADALDELRPRDLLPLHGAHARRAARAGRRRSCRSRSRHLTGNGCHFHMSLWKNGENVFLDESDALGLSSIGVQLHRRPQGPRPASSALTAPTVNSYKRLKLGSTSSGATWSPVWISYGYNNRTQMLRIPAPGRIEDRTVDGSCNPYLAAAAVLASGLDGIANGLDAGEPNAENLYSFSYDS